MSPSKTPSAKAEKARLREQKKMQRADLEKMREQQNASDRQGERERPGLRALSRDPSGLAPRVAPVLPSPRGTRGARVPSAPSRALVSTRSRARTAPTIVSASRETRVERSGRERPLARADASGAARSAASAQICAPARRALQLPIFLFLLVSPARSPTPAACSHPVGHRQGRVEGAAVASDRGLPHFPGLRHQGGEGEAAAGAAGKQAEEDEDESRRSSTRRSTRRCASPSSPSASSSGRCASISLAGLNWMIRLFDHGINGIGGRDGSR